MSTEDTVPLVLTTIIVVGLGVGWCVCLVRFAMGIVRGVEEASDPAHGFFPNMNDNRGPKRP